MTTATKSRPKAKNRAERPSIDAVEIEGFAVLMIEDGIWTIYGITIEEDEAYDWVTDATLMSHGRGKVHVVRFSNSVKVGAA